MSATLKNHPQHAQLTSLANSLQVQFGPLLRVLQLDEADNPDVVSSFDITETPTFVLVKQGVELWRRVGLCAEELLVRMIREYIKEDGLAL